MFPLKSIKERKEKKEALKNELAALDEELFSEIQPQGGITFADPAYITAGDGYIKTLHIYQLPKQLKEFWIDDIFNIPDTVATFDMSTRDIAEVKKNINRSLKEEFSRSATAKDFMELYDATQRQEELKSLLHELSAMGEVIKMVHFRIFVRGRSVIELEDKCESIMKSLEGDTYMTTTLLNEGKREWESLFESYHVQHKKPFYIRAHPLTTEQLALGDPFDYSELIDEMGDLVGFTPTDGVVIFDEFTKTKSRKHYNSLVTGDMGSGKSTFLKKRFKANAAKGNFVRTFDVTGEFSELTREFGGKIIKCNGESGILNPLEILKAGEDDYTSYARHLSKVSTFFKCIVPTAEEGMLIELENYLRDFYEKYDLLPEEGKDITGLPADRYPTFSDLLSFVDNELDVLKQVKATNEVDMTLLKDKALNLSAIEKAVKNIVLNYGRMFDGHSSVDNLIDEKIVTFDISDIKDLGNVFTAQMFNLVSLCWDNAVGNGSIMKNLWETGKIKDIDVTKFLIIIDESHRWVNTRLPMILDLLIKYLREARKFFAGMIFASQSVRDYIPEGTNAPNIDMIKTLFELTQYKFIFRQDSSVVPLLNSIFNNALTYSQIEQIPFLDIGESILSISGDRSLKIAVWLSKDYEENIFKGGR